MRDAEAIVQIIRACFDGVIQLSTVIVIAYAIRTAFQYLRHRLDRIGAEPVARACPNCAPSLTVTDTQTAQERIFER